MAITLNYTTWRPPIEAFSPVLSFFLRLTPHQRAKRNSRTGEKAEPPKREPATFHGATTSKEERSEVGLGIFKEEVAKS
ncbi:MAG: hypothetical protein A3F51_02670 [Candidatus Taylorbacteria bacterium RIFCSPHIGHO2_12_FULL_45_16]|uniref:Uncharacterized protein n=1 Tax=Candidatus Taylorbacteria bacterium RIFCSPHIGHO2_12_FULL_45_16 TaxID=1802315 RepID=A0A1G2MXR0_9BACT|nr:MAG: hypothetical protein A3F51_02670 [Candidatus Taylorbacteria bacterium RIFCSPHIGHO2_12_FULL_45_16]